MLVRAGKTGDEVYNTTQTSPQSERRLSHVHGDRLLANLEHLVAEIWTAVLLLAKRSRGVRLKRPSKLVSFAV